MVATSNQVTAIRNSPQLKIQPSSGNVRFNRKFSSYLFSNYFTCIRNRMETVNIRLYTRNSVNWLMDRQAATLCCKTTSSELAH